MPCPEKFRETLAQFNISDSTIRQIEKGYEGIVSKTPKKSPPPISSVPSTF